MNSPSTPPASFFGFLLRLYWMFLGNVVLLFLLYLIFDRKAAFPARFDALYLGTVASIVAARYIDIRYLKGETGDGRPATLKDWRNHATTVTVAGAIAWGLLRTTV